MRRRSFLVSPVGLLALELAACARTITPDQVKVLARRTYDGHTRADVVKASSLALKTLGYQVVVEDADAGMVKTAPKPLLAMASGNATSAVAVTNDLAWMIEVSAEGDGVAVQATPRASAGGQSYDGPYDADYIEKAIIDLFKEIESNLKPAKS
jgi:hypothetical protein